VEHPVKNPVSVCPLVAEWFDWSASGQGPTPHYPTQPGTVTWLMVTSLQQSSRGQGCPRSHPTRNPELRTLKADEDRG